MVVISILLKCCQTHLTVKWVNINSFLMVNVQKNQRKSYYLVCHIDLQVYKYGSI